MSNTASHPAVLAAASFGALHSNATSAKGEAGLVLEGWTSAKLQCAIQYGVSCAADPDALALAADVANAFTLAATGKALSGPSLASQGRKFVAFGRLGRDVEPMIANIRRVVDDLGAIANNKTSDADDKTAAKRANIRVFEKAVSLARLAGKLGSVNLSTGDIKGVLCEGDEPTLGKHLGNAVAALEKALAMVPDADWKDYMGDIKAAYNVAKSEDDAAKEKRASDRRALEASEMVAEAKAIRDALKAAGATNKPAPVAAAPVEISEDEMLGGLLTA